MVNVVPMLEIYCILIILFGSSLLLLVLVSLYSSAAFTKYRIFMIFPTNFLFSVPVRSNLCISVLNWKQERCCLFKILTLFSLSRVTLESVKTPKNIFSLVLPGSMED